MTKCNFGCAGLSAVCLPAWPGPTCQRAQRKANDMAKDQTTPNPYDDGPHYEARSVAFEEAYKLPEGAKRQAAIDKVNADYPILKASGDDWVALRWLLDRADNAALDFHLDEASYRPFLREGLRFLSGAVAFAASEIARGGDGRGGVMAMVENTEEFLNRIKEHYHEEGEPGYKLIDDVQVAMRKLMQSDDGPLYDSMHPDRQGPDRY